MLQILWCCMQIPMHANLSMLRNMMFYVAWLLCNFSFFFHWMNWHVCTWVGELILGTKSQILARNLSKFEFHEKLYDLENVWIGIKIRTFSPNFLCKNLNFPREGFRKFSSLHCIIVEKNWGWNPTCIWYVPEW